MSKRKPKPDGKDGPRGLSCPKCGCRHLPVWYTRPRRGYTLRVRSCRNCGHRVTTRERI